MRFWRGRSRRVRAFVALTSLLLLAVVASVALGQSNPLNDLFALGQGTGDSPTTAPIQKPPDPSYAATPAPASCAPGSNPEPGVDGRVPASSIGKGLNCNISLVGHQGTEGGFKTFRYVDPAGHVCAFYDTTLLFPTNFANPGGGSHGIAVLDMSDPAHPKQTATLDTIAMESPHESLNLNPERGLLAAVNGNPSTYPGFVSIYDVSQDCRHPILDADGPYARFGHESGFSSDGKTFYATSTALQAITAIDVTNPKQPHAIWQGNVYSHGMSLSDDGNRAYIADPKGNMLILDTSQIQARKPNPTVREVSRLTWDKASIPQNAIPFTENGHPYVLEFDEYTQQTLNPSGDPDQVGAARIIDIGDETHPVVISNIRLAIDNPEEHKAAKGDPGTSDPAQGYAAHYCNIPTRVNPKVVACSFIASGLRVFDISDLLHPKEIAYYVAASKKDTQNGYDGSNFAMSMPAFAPDRQIWYTDGPSGFYVLQVDKSVWPTGTGNAKGNACTAKSRARHFRVRKGKVKRVRVTLTKSGRRVRGAVVRVRGAGIKRKAKTNRRGQVVFKLKAHRRGRVTVSSPGCGRKLRVKAIH